MVPEKLGPYRIGKTLGKGGMGAVYRGTHVDTGEVVAVKALSPHLAVSEGFRDRFEAEIESLRTLRHAGIVRLFGYGEEEGVLFYAMELVNGPSLEQELRNGRRFNWRETAMIATQVSRALKHAHDHGVVHRDIKPANILLGEKGQAKLADFGIARLFGSTGVTVAGGVLGTADYMSPEQAAGQPVTSRCDQYSLGGVMYALLSGRPPFRANDLPTMLQLQRFSTPDPVGRYAPNTPRQLEKVIAQLLEKDPADRFPNTLVLAKHLEAMVRALGKPAEDDFDVYDGEVDVDVSDELSNAVTIGPTEYESGGSSLDSDDDSAISVEYMTDSTPSQSMVASPVAEEIEIADPEPTRSYTAVDYGEKQEAPAWRLFAGQLLVLALSIGMIGGIIWWWTQPLSSDALYQRIAEAHEEGSTDYSARDSVNEFVERFPNDKRLAEVQEWGEIMDLRLLRKRLSLGRLVASRQGKPLPAEETLYREANELAKKNSRAGAEAFFQLAELLRGPHGVDADHKQRQVYAELARREAARYSLLADAEDEQLAKFCDERLKQAEQMLRDRPEQAKIFLESLINLMPKNDRNQASLKRAKELLNNLQAADSK